MRVSPSGVISLIAREGKRNYAYPDPASELYLKSRGEKWGFIAAETIFKRRPELRKLSGAPWTCGVGITGPGVTKDTFWTESQIKETFTRHLKSYEAEMNRYLGDAPTTSNQFDAMVSLLFNIGGPNFSTSTVLREHKAGNYAAAGRAFSLFNKAKGKVNSILIRRRADEAAQYLSDLPVEEETPVKIDPERSMAKSEINITSAVSATAAGATAVSATMDAISGKEVAFIMVIIIVLLGYIIYQRVKQRKEGWA